MYTCFLWVSYFVFVFLVSYLLDIMMSSSYGYFVALWCYLFRTMYISCILFAHFFFFFFCHRSKTSNINFHKTYVSNFFSFVLVVCSGYLSYLPLSRRFFPLFSSTFKTFLSNMLFYNIKILPHKFDRILKHF